MDAPAALDRDQYELNSRISYQSGEIIQVAVKSERLTFHDFSVQSGLHGQFN